MNGKQLKNSILQWAIQGRLVPQDPNDEPASVLLERIRTEKARLVKEGKIKKDKNESIIFRGDDNSHYEKLPNGEVRCIDSDIPFEIPSNWCWERFGNLVINRDSERIPLSIAQRTLLSKVYDYYGASGVIDKVDKYLFGKDLLLIGEDGANLINRSTPIAFIAHGQYWVNNHAHVIDCINSTFMQYVCLYINAISLVDYVTGTAQPKMNQEKMNSIMVCVPPLKEQSRIISRIEELAPIIERYNSAQTELDSLNNNIKLSLRKSILQEAIQGRLVEQCVTEEPAYLLLERINEEKKKLVKQGVLRKKDLKDSLIFKGDDNKYYEKCGNAVACIDDEIPFEIPDTWCWCKIGDLFMHNNGKQLNKGNSRGKLMEYITTSNLYWDGFVLENLKQMPFEDSEIERCTAKKGDLLVCEGGDVGRACIWPYDQPIMLQNHLHKLRAYLPICTEYIYYVFYLYNQMGIIGGKGIGIQGFSSKALHNTKIPLPPLEEQRRIVAKIQQALASIMSR